MSDNEEKGLVKTQTAAVSRVSSFAPTNLQEAISFSKLVATSELVPKDFKGKPGNVLIAIQMGAEVGLAPMQALQSIAVINGRPCLWGDGALAVVQTHRTYESHREWFEGTGDTRTAVCEFKRKGSDVHKTKFSVADAKVAGLWGKIGPWKTNPDRMLQMRARGFGMRDKFADALRGMSIAEEAMDMVVREVRVVETASAPANLSELTPSSEPNRGHGNEGFEREKQEPAKTEDVICNECRVTNGHSDTCPQNQDKVPEPTVEPKKEYTRLTVMVTDVAVGNARKSNVFLKLACFDAESREYELISWHKNTQHAHLLKAKDQECEFGTEEIVKDNRPFVQIEEIYRIGKQKFENNAPVAESPSAEQMGFDPE
jgi:hypothetical protein